MSTIEIFPARLEMADLMAVHHERSFATPWGSEAFAQMLGVPGAFGFVIALSDETVGFILARVAGGESEILTLAIDPEHRGQHLGRRLLAVAIDKAQVLGAQEMFLEVADDNHAALKIYSAAGFIRVGQRPGYYKESGRVTDALTLKRSL